MTEDVAQTILRLNRETYEKIAPEFDKTRRILWDDFSTFDPYVKEGMRVLDVGCGNGRLYRYLKDKGIEYCGIDQNRYLIDQARTRYPGVIFLQGDILQLGNVAELSGRQFDCVFCISLLSHIPSHEYRRYVLSSMRQYLRQNGILCMLNWNLWRPGWRQKNIWTGNMQRLFLETDVWAQRYTVPERRLDLRDVMAWWGNAYQGSPLYYRAFGTTELKKLCRACGFYDVSSFYVRRGKRAWWWSGRNIATIARMTPVPVKAPVTRSAAIPVPSAA